MEQDHRIKILNSLLTTPHRDLNKIYNEHKSIVDSDPLFYKQLAAWYFDNGEIRDSKEAFISTLCINEDEDLRNVGLALLRQLPPYQVRRVVDFVKSKKKNIPRSVVTEVTRYLRDREENQSWFDSSVLQAKKHIKRLYSFLHISPSDYAQAVLFDNEIPEDSVLYQVKNLVKAQTPVEQAEIILRYKIPYRIASSVIKDMTPTVLFALIDVMTSQELLNNLGSLNKRGVMKHPDLKKVIEEKLEKAKDDKKVASLKNLKVVESANLSEDLNAKVMNIADNQVKSKGRITKPTAIFVDKSFSMSEGIEVGKQMAALISSVMDAPLYCYAFDVMPYEINSKGKSLDQWTKAFSGIKARGGTNPSVPFVLMQSKKIKVEQIILITDEGENVAGWYLKGLSKYEQFTNQSVNTFILRCGNKRYRHEVITNSLKKNDKEVDTYDFDGDYYSLPGLITYLTRPSKLELLMEIMSYPIPKRKLPVHN